MNKILKSALIIVTFLAIIYLFVFLWNNPPFKYNYKDTYYQGYWDSQKLIQYITQTYTDLHVTGFGNGKLEYTKDGKDFLIHCSQIFIDNRVIDCCREGEVSWVVKYDPDTITWINITNQIGECEK